VGGGEGMVDAIDGHVLAWIHLKKESKEKWLIAFVSS